MDKLAGDEPGTAARYNRDSNTFVHQAQGAAAAPHEVKSSAK
jgi:hypothetical protein